MSEQSPTRDSDCGTDVEPDLDPFLQALFAEARAAETADPDIAGLAEHLVANMLGGPAVAASRVRAARTAAALRRRPDLARRAASMQRRLERLAAGAEDPGEQFERLRRELSDSAIERLSD